MTTLAAAAALTLDFDGLKINVWSEKDGEVHLKIDNYEEVHLSPSTAKILGIALMQLSEPED